MDWWGNLVANPECPTHDREHIAAGRCGAAQAGHRDGHGWLLGGGAAGDSQESQHQVREFHLHSFYRNFNTPILKRH
jgi:hypothetical protein